jgi:oligopeptidase B
MGFTSRGRIVAHGGSAGGMLMGAVANMAPDLFLGVIAEVPFVDVLTTMLDASLPLTPPEWPEWGNPIESAEAYRTIAAYSPYDNVKAQPYPHILALAGLTDPRVTYWEPAKWVAKLRELKTGDRLLLLRTNMDAGHAGASGRFERLKEVALAYAFALKIAGLGGPA